MHLPKIIGAITYVITYPLILVWLKGSRRSYVALIVDDNLLVTKNWLGLHKKWRLPGGGVRKDESTIIGVQREVKEELGLQLSEENLQLLVGNNNTAKAGYTYDVYVVRYQQKPHITPNMHELVAVEWIPIAELANQQLSLELRTTLKLLSKG